MGVIFLPRPAVFSVSMASPASAVHSTRVWVRWACISRISAPAVCLNPGSINVYKITFLFPFSWCHSFSVRVRTPAPNEIRNQTFSSSISWRFPIAFGNAVLTLIFAVWPCFQDGGDRSDFASFSLLLTPWKVPLISSRYSPLPSIATVSTFQPAVC